MKKWKLILVLVISAALQTGCEKKCSNVTLNIILCDDGYENLNEKIYFLDEIIERTDYKVIDSILYDSIFSYSKPLGNIDFNTHFIIGVSRMTNPGDGITKKAVICENAVDQKLKLKVAYSLTGQCKGSEISNKNINVWAVLPIKYKNYTIEYEVIDINPF